MTAAAVIAFALGVLLGVAYFRALAWNVRLYLAGRRGAAVALHAARLAIVACALYAAARVGAAPLLAAAGGLLAARLVATRREAR